MVGSDNDVLFPYCAFPVAAISSYKITSTYHFMWSFEVVYH
jgi:hypothetical protein